MQPDNNPFSTDHIIALISEQYPQRQDLIRAMHLCNAGQWESPAYLRFVNDVNPNETGSEWQFMENVILESDSSCTIVPDVLKDGRIGGIEFLSQLTPGFK